MRKNNLFTLKNKLKQNIMCFLKGLGENDNTAKT